VWTQDGARRVVLATERADAARRDALEKIGVEIWTVPADGEGRASLAAAATRLGREGYANLLVEGGGALVGSLLRDQLADVLWVAMSPRVLLGGGGPGWTEGLRVESVARAVRIARAAHRPLGPDWLFTLVPESAQWWDPEA
jgi:diaminohydroxyphosphoribosylaminopyrimidine deaminase/5-amino-6-(5-phosphoribosylamino)uracil reductase